MILYCKRCGKRFTEYVDDERKHCPECSVKWDTEEDKRRRLNKIIYEK